MRRLDSLEKWWLWIVLAGLLAVRFVHLSPRLDDPHSWRQADTANYALDLYRNGMHPLRPSVCWQGPHPTVILELPAFEVACALAYRVTGESLVVDRLLAILMWLLSAWYLYRLIDYLHPESEVALYGLVVYAALPLGIYYSRAIQTDFTAIFAAHAMTFHWLRGLDRGSRRDLLVGTGFAVLACLIKVPYAFCFGPALVAFCLAEGRIGQAARQGFIFLVPAAAFAVWWRYVMRVNDAAPDYSFIPGYFKFVHMGFWYFGPLAERLSHASWAVLFRRLWRELLTPAGVAILLVAMGIRLGSGRRLRLRARPVVIGLGFSLGLLLYLLIFFNLNVIHDYYQVPFLAAAAWLLALAILGIARRFPARRRLVAPTLATLLAIAGVTTALEIYYQPDPLRDAAGAAIERATAPGEMVVATMADTDPRDPRLLYRAHRHGFAIPLRELTPPVLAKLRGAGATTLALLVERDAQIPEWLRARGTLRRVPVPAPGGEWLLLLGPLSQ